MIDNITTLMNAINVLISSLDPVLVAAVIDAASALSS